MIKSDRYEEEKINTTSKDRNSPSKSYNSSSKRHSTDPSQFTLEWDNIKPESDRKIIKGFFISGIKQYYKDKLERNTSLNIENSKVVYVHSTIPEITISDGEALINCKIDSSIRQESDIDLKELKGKYLKLNDWNFTVKMESVVLDNHDHTKILVNIK